MTEPASLFTQADAEWAALSNDERLVFVSGLGTTGFLPDHHRMAIPGHGPVRMEIVWATWRDLPAGFVIASCKCAQNVTEAVFDPRAGLWARDERTIWAARTLMRTTLLLKLADVLDNRSSTGTC